MYLKVNRDEVIEGLHKSASIIPAKTGAAYLRTIWLKSDEGNLRIMSTDSNLEFCGTYPAEIIEEGLAGVQGRAFYDLVRKLPSGELVIKSDPDGSSILVEQGARKYKLPVNDPTWFQKFSTFPTEGAVYWSGDLLLEIIERIAFCISDEDSMEAIACMNIVPSSDENGKYVEACGLNGHQFARLKFINDDIHALLPEEGILIQKKYLSELKKWLTNDEIEMSLIEKRLFFKTADGKETFSMPLSYYQYPNYKNFLSKLNDDDVSRMKVQKSELSTALDRISIFNTDSNRCASFMFNPGELILFSQGQEVGTATESIEVEFSGEMERIAFPTKNLIEILGHFQSGKISFTLTGSEAPCGLTGDEDNEYLVIVMPMKVQEETYYSEEDV